MVVVGNGIAGITAADQRPSQPSQLRNRRRSRGRAPPLQPDGDRAADLRRGRRWRDSISMEEQWYERHPDHDLAEHAASCAIDRGAQRRCGWARARRSKYDRLILAAGAANIGAGDRGVRRWGHVCVREAEDAMRDSRLRPGARLPPGASRAAACSGWRRRTRCKKLGLKVTVLERRRVAAAPSVGRAGARTSSRSIPRGARAAGSRLRRCRPSSRWQRGACAGCLKLSTDAASWPSIFLVVGGDLAERRDWHVTPGWRSTAASSSTTAADERPGDLRRRGRRGTQGNDLRTVAYGR